MYNSRNVISWSNKDYSNPFALYTKWNRKNASDSKKKMKEEKKKDNNIGNANKTNSNKEKIEKIW